MVTINYNKKSGNYILKNEGKEFVHQTLKSAQEQLSAILRVKRKREMRKAGKVVNS